MPVLHSLAQLHSHIHGAAVAKDRQLSAPVQSSGPHAPGHSAQDLIALENVVTKRTSDMDDHDRGEHIGKHHMRLLDRLAHRTAHRRNDRWDVESK